MAFLHLLYGRVTFINGLHEMRKLTAAARPPRWMEWLPLIFEGMCFSPQIRFIRFSFLLAKTTSFITDIFMYIRGKIVFFFKDVPNKRYTRGQFSIANVIIESFTFKKYIF